MRALSIGLIFITLLIVGWKSTRSSESSTEADSNRPPAKDRRFHDKLKSPSYHERKTTNNSERNKDLAKILDGGDLDSAHLIISQKIKESDFGKGLDNDLDLLTEILSDISKLPKNQRHAINLTTKLVGAFTAAQKPESINYENLVEILHRSSNRSFNDEDTRTNILKKIASSLIIEIKLGNPESKKITENLLLREDDTSLHEAIATLQTLSILDSKIDAFDALSDIENLSIRSKIESQLLIRIIENNPQKAANYYFSDLCQIGSDSDFATLLFGHHLENNPEIISTAILQTPPSNKRDSAILSMIRRVAKDDPEGATAWSSEIIDPSKKAEALSLLSD